MSQISRSGEVRNVVRRYVIVIDGMNARKKKIRLDASVSTSLMQPFFTFISNTLVKKFKVQFCLR